MPIVAFSQIAVQGIVKGVDGEGVPFAHVVLRQVQDSSLISGTMTGADGAFALSANAGEFLLNISMTGYRPEFFFITVDAAQQELLLGDLFLKEDITELGVVEVTALKPRIEKLTDRTVVNVANSVAGTGMSALAILERSPGIVVSRQSGTLSMNGRTGVQVMINGKPTRMPAETLMQMLDGINSASIEKIELITIPPARYEAEGNGGIINIVTTESADEGTNGSVAIGAGYARREVVSGNVGINHRKGPFSATLSYSLDRSQNVHYWSSDYTIVPNDVAISNLSDSRRTPLTTVQNLSLGAEYRFNDRTSATLLLTGYRRKWDMDARTINTYQESDDPVVSTDMAIWEVNTWQSGTASLGIHHRLTERQDISFSFDYLRYDNDNPSSYHNTTVDRGVEDVILVKKVTPISFRVASFDYTNALRPGLTLEAGAKATLSKFTNTVRVDQPLSDDTDLNAATLDESIMAAYTSLHWEPVQDWVIRGGLRYEHTDSYLTSPSEGVLVDRNFGNLFPDLTVTHSLGTTGKAQLAYSRRVTRPTFNDMAPFVFYIGPTTFVSGNLSLRPSIADAIEASLQWGDIWFALRYNDISEEIAEFQPFYDEEAGALVIHSDNMTYSRSIGLSVSTPWRPWSWWEAQMDLSAYHQWYELDYVGATVRRNMNRVEVTMTNIFLLPSDFSVELSGSYQSAMPMGLSQFKSRTQINLGVKRQFGNSTLALVYNDVFNGMEWRFVTDVPEIDFHSYTRYDWGTRLIKLTYSYTFGNKKLKEVDVRSGSEDERKRVQ
ncbi:MAG TPA: outer membrane beta-barrel protein [Cyclobacteriaceae bacterium]|jgi:outer membrane receptor protein involved in Fe transport